MPRISLLIPTYNRRSLLPFALDSVRFQTFGDFECLIHDDGSTDGTIDDLEALARHDDRFHVTRSENIGVARVIDYLSSRAVGEWIGILDSDDYLAPTCFERSLSVADRSGADLVYTKYVEVYPDRSLQPGARNNIEFSPLRLLVDHCLFHFRLIRRSKFFEAGGIDTAYPIAYDYDLALRLSEVCRVVHLPEYLYYHRVFGDDRISIARRAEQAYYSYRAVCSALRRRGLDHEYSIQFDYAFKIYRN